MKLRIRGNSIRLRLTQSEVDKIKSFNSIEEITEFPNGQNFVYSLSATAENNQILANFADGKIEISISKSIAETWASSDEVGIYGTHGNIQIAVEKDFKCLTPRVGDEYTDTFPHPKEGSYDC